MTPPEPSPSIRPALLAAAVAVGLMVVGGLWVAQSGSDVSDAPEGMQARGIRGTHGGQVDLTFALSAARGEEVWRVADGEKLRPGDRVYFRVGASPASAVTLWVEGPNGLEPITTTQAGPDAADLASEAGLLAWEFDGEGEYVFAAGTGEAGDCADKPCDRVRVKVKAADAAPGVHARTIDGKAFDLDAAVAARPVALAFWSLDCGDCKAELAKVAKAAASGVQVVAVSTDPVQEASRVRPWLHTAGLGDLTALTDADGALAKRFEVAEVPAVVLIGTDGAVEGRWTGRTEEGAVASSLAAVARAR